MEGCSFERGYRSLADFPLVTNGKIIGVILFYSSEVNYFDQEEIQLLQGLSKIFLCLRGNGKENKSKML